MKNINEKHPSPTNKVLVSYKRDRQSLFATPLGTAQNMPPTFLFLPYSIVKDQTDKTRQQKPNSPKPKSPRPKATSATLIGFL
jgi:hypothetical protein